MVCIACIGGYDMLEIAYHAGRIDFKDNKAGRENGAMIVRIVQIDMYGICM